ncbi:hypothetical protein ACJMK2_003894 [Sinanodonta woodiana]|uniref:G-protein coupled receptors family 1 profile domain-containing protein n=1 Tax=Sinanodonta woodiana TaxID=1069815 RepID=A0ABD3Y064_SINWO
MDNRENFPRGGALEVNPSTMDVYEKHNTNVTENQRTLEEINDAEVMLLLPVMVFYVTIMAFGIIGNIFVLIIYFYRFKRMSARCYILTLAMLDLGVCCIGIPYHIFDLLHPYTYFSSAACKTLTFLLTFFTYGSIFVLLVVGIDRFLKICRPLKRQMSDFGSRKACLIAVGTALLIAWPQVVIYGHSTAIPSGHLNITGVECFIDDSYKHTRYPLIYIGFIIFIAISTILTLIALYSCICYQIFLYEKRQADLLRTTTRFNFCSCKETKNPTNVKYVTSLSEEETESTPLDTFENENGKQTDMGNSELQTSGSSSRSRSQCTESVRSNPEPVAASNNKRKITRKITMMMLSITVVFVISYTPSTIMLLADRLVEGLWENNDTTKIKMYDFLLRSYVINNVANPIIYGFWDNRFRSECILLLKRVCFCHCRTV